MTYPGPDVPSTPGEQPSGATAAAQAPAAAPAEKSGLKKWLPIGGSLAVAGVVAASWLTGGFGPGEPEVGDCGKATGETSFEVVDCDAEGAEFKIVGIQDGKQSYQEFEKDENSCSAFPKWEVALWSGEMTEEGTVYCAEGL
jgi:hypothetical protein